jgi:phosphate transport system protein
MIHMIRKNFDYDLEQLKKKLLNMSALVEVAIKDSIEALKTQNLTLAEQVIEGDKEINRLEDEIEDLVVRIIASQQPVASDLRKIMSALKITTSVERIGDFAVDIAKAAKRIGNQNLIKPLQDIPAMAEIAQTMIREGINAYIDNDVEKAQEMADMDDKVDKMYASIVKELLQKIVEHPDKIEQIMQLAFVARYIERTADHCTNIAEAILYIVKGKRVDLNQ